MNQVHILFLKRFFIFQACQLEMKRLKANEIKLSTELSIIKQDNKRLSVALSNYQNGHDSIV